MDPRKLIDWLALHLLPGLGPIGARRALERYRDPGRIAHRVPSAELRGLGRVRPATIAEIRPTLRARAERELRLCGEHGIRPLPLEHPDYPAALREIPDPPVLLYVRGTLPPGVVRLAVVGSRTPTVYGRRVAAGLASGLAARGIEVVSGGARGIDAIAHRAALEEDGRTVAVLGSGLLRPYPPENAGLLEEIGRRGAVVSEFPLEQEPLAEQFPRRNRLISGLCAAVLVVEAARRSGTLSTAGHALDQGREVLAVPGPVHSMKSVGCHRLIQQGAKLVQNIEDLLDELPPLYRGAVAQPSGPSAAETRADLTRDEADVLGILEGAEPVHLDRLAVQVAFGIARLQAALLGLELRGAVEQCPGRYYVLRPPKEPLGDG